MPKAKAKLKITLLDQVEQISNGIDEAAEVLADLVAHAKTLDALRHQLLDALAARGGQIAEVLGEASAQKVQPQFLAKFRAVEKSNAAIILKLQSNLQRESQVITAVSNILKAKHDTVKSSIGNVA